MPKMSNQMSDIDQRVAKKPGYAFKHQTGWFRFGGVAHDSYPIPIGG